MCSSTRALLAELKGIQLRFHRCIKVISSSADMLWSAVSMLKTLAIHSFHPSVKLNSTDQHQVQVCELTTVSKQDQR